MGILLHVAASLNSSNSPFVLVQAVLSDILSVSGNGINPFVLGKGEEKKYCSHALHNY